MTRAYSIAAVCVPAAVLALVLGYAVDVPYWDDWGFGSLLVRIAATHDPLGQLWAAQNNEHRTVFPAALAFALTAFGGWHPLREVACNVSVACLTFILVVRMIRETVPARVQAAVLVLDSLLLFSLAQMESWLAGFQLTWYVMDLAVVAVVWLLAGPHLDRARLTGAAACAFVAAFASADGVFAVPLGAALLFSRRPRPVGAFAVWLVFGTLTAVLFALSFHPLPPQADVAYAAGSVWDAVLYPLAYLGAPLLGFAGAVPSALLGVAGLGAFAALWRRARDDWNAAPWLALAWYGILSALLTGHGRVGLGLGGALAARYTVVAALFWVGLTGLAAPWYAALLETRKAAPLWAARCALALLVAAFAREQIDGPRNGANIADARRTGLLAVRRLPAASDDDLSAIYPNPPYVRVLVPELEAIGQAPFARPAAN